MARLVGPLMSLDASGSIAGALTFAKNKGRQYVRQLVIPANPKSPAQTAFRAYMRFLSQVWAQIDTYIGAGTQGSWQQLADASNVSPFNAFTKYNQGRLKFGEQPAYAYPPVGTPGDATGDSFTATGAVRQAILSITNSNNGGDAITIIHRGDVTGFTPALANVIAVLDTFNGGVITYTDSPLDPGTYFYRVGMASGDDGTEAMIVAEHSATVT